MQQVFRFHAHLTQLYALHFAKLLHAATLTPDFVALHKGLPISLFTIYFHVTCDEEVTSYSRDRRSNCF